MEKLNEKREEIREIIDTYTDDSCLFPDRSCNVLAGGYCASTEEAYKCLMERLGKIGCVLKVDRELPDDFCATIQRTWVGEDEIGCERITTNKAFPAQFKSRLEGLGYVAVEPLLEERDAEERV